MSANETGIAIDLAAEADFALGTLLVRPSSREVALEGRAEMLEPRIMQVLIALARRSGEVVSRDELIRVCWGGRVVGEDAINRCIARVRKLSSRATFTLETIPRVGYRLVASPSEPVVEKEPAPTPPAAEPVTPSSEPNPEYLVRPARRRHSRISIAILVLLVLATGAVFLSNLWRGIQYVNVAAQPYFAVLSFDVVGTDPDTAHLADAIPAAISNQLTSLGFQGISPAVSFQYRGDRKAEAARNLSSRYVIDGVIRLEGGKVHVSTRVDSGAWHVSVWSQEFDAGASEAGVLPERIATSLASNFRPSWRSMPRGSPKLMASIFRIAARARAGDDMGSYLAAKELLRDMPDTVGAQIYYADAVARALDLFSPDDRTRILANARRAASRADASWSNGAALAVVAVMPFAEWSARERVLRTGLETDSTADRRYARSALLANSGRVAEALSISEQGMIIDPLSSGIVLNHANILDIAGHREEADALLVRAKRLWPGVEGVERLRFSSAVARGDLQAASAMLRDPVSEQLIDPPAPRRPYAAILRALAKRDPAEIAQIESACADPSSLARDRGPLCLRGLIALGRLETFFKVAPAYFPDQRGASAAERDALWLKYPKADRNLRVLFRADTKAVRADERFIPIVERMGLLDYWRTNGKWPDFCETEPQSVCARLKEQR